MKYTREYILPFLDGLLEIIPQKLREILEEMEYLEAKRVLALEAVKTIIQREGKDEVRDYMALSLVEYEFVRYFVLKRELNKWLRLGEMLDLSPEKEQVNSDSFNEDQIAQVKARSIEDYYEDKLRGYGSRLIGKCPFHVEKTGSFVVYSNDNTFHCFGCGKHGDVIDFLMLTRKLTFREAVGELL